MLVYLARRSHVLSFKYYPYKKGGCLFFFFLVNDSNIYFRPWNRKATSLLLFKIKIHKWIANSTVQERIWKAGWRNFRKWLQISGGPNCEWTIYRLVDLDQFIHPYFWGNEYLLPQMENGTSETIFKANYHRLLIEDCMAAVKIYTT